MELLFSPWDSALAGLKRDHHMASLHTQAVQVGAIAPEWHLIVSPIALEPMALKVLTKRLAIIERLIFDLPTRLFDGDHAAFHHALGLE